MLRKAILAAFVLALSMVVFSASAARMETPDGNAIARDVIAGGGGQSTTTNGNVLVGTIGQPVAAVSTATNGTTLVGGFHVMIPRGPTIVRTWQLY